MTGLHTALLTLSAWVLCSGPQREGMLLFAPSLKYCVAFTGWAISWLTCSSLANIQCSEHLREFYYFYPGLVQGLKNFFHLIKNDLFDITKVYNPLKDKEWAYTLFENVLSDLILEYHRFEMFSSLSGERESIGEHQPPLATNAWLNPRLEDVAERQN